jgi:hypothetical protein
MSAYLSWSTNHRFGDGVRKARLEKEATQVKLDPQPQEQVILELAETKSYHRQKIGRTKRERLIASSVVADLYIDTCEQLDNISFLMGYYFVNLVSILCRDNGAQQCDMRWLARAAVWQEAAQVAVRQETAQAAVRQAATVVRLLLLRRRPPKGQRGGGGRVKMSTARGRGHWRCGWIAKDMTQQANPRAVALCGLPALLWTSESSALTT